MKHARTARWPAERNHVLLLCGLCFWAGCGMASRLTDGLWLWALAGLSLPLGFALYKLGKRATVALALCVFALGALRAMPCLRPQTPAPAVYESITGYVYGEPRPRADSRITFTLTDVELDGVKQHGRAYCSLYYGMDGMPELYDGAHLQMSGRVYLPDGKSGEPRMDFRLWMLQNDMSYGIAIYKTVTVLNAKSTAPVMDGAYRLRERLSAALESVMGDNARLATAMLLNDREGVSEQEYEAFQQLGIAHVLSVSGLHVGVLGGVLLWLLSRLRVRKALQFIPLGAFLLTYCAVTGFSAATMRASAMLLCALLAQAWGRRRDPLSTLGGAMLAVLLIDPLQAYSAGFALSFSAVAGLMLLSGTFRWALDRLLPTGGVRRVTKPSPRERLRRFSIGLLRWLKRALSASMAAQLGVLLPTALYFHSLPLYGVFINLLVIPYTTLLVPVFAIVLLLSPLPYIGMGAGALATLMSDLFWRGLHWLAELPYASVRVASPSAIWMAGGVFVLVIFSRLFRAEWRRKLAAAALVCAVAGSAAYCTRPPDTRYVQLAAGQADAALLFAGDQTVAVDVGADGSAVIDYLMDTGRDLDALILTHLHLDHAGGVQPILDAGVRIRRVYLPVNADAQRLESDSLAILQAIRDASIPITFLAKGDELRYNDTVLRALWPDGENVRRMQDANDLPLVLAIELDGYTILSASDLTGRYERYAAIPCDVLKVAHHGSRDSTFDDFLALASPRVAIISCSSGSRSLPGAETLERLDTHGVETLRTDETGDITLWVEDGRLIVAPYKARITK